MLRAPSRTYTLVSMPFCSGGLLVQLQDEWWQSANNNRYFSSFSIIRQCLCFALILSVFPVAIALCWVLISNIKVFKLSISYHPFTHEPYFYTFLFLVMKLLSPQVTDYPDQPFTTTHGYRDSSNQSRKSDVSAKVLPNVACCLSPLSFKAEK